MTNESAKLKNLVRSPTRDNIMAVGQRDRGIPALVSITIFSMSAEIRTANPLSKFLECYLCSCLFVCSGNCLHTCVYITRGQNLYSLHTVRNFVRTDHSTRSREITCIACAFLTWKWPESIGGLAYCCLNNLASRGKFTFNGTESYVDSNVTYFFRWIFWNS
jgi:hypothetical protein